MSNGEGGEDFCVAQRGRCADLLATFWGRGEGGRMVVEELPLESLVTCVMRVAAELIRRSKVYGRTCPRH